jgi:hypothetical protein
MPDEVGVIGAHSVNYLAEILLRWMLVQIKCYGTHVGTS